PPATLSEQLTSAADDLFVAEQKAAAVWRKVRAEDGVEAVLYEDVLALLDAAIGADPANFHAHALSARILLLKAYQGDGVYDVCGLLDARDDAEYVADRAGSAPAADLASARDILKQIRRIPPSAIPDPPSSCGEEDHDSTGKTSETR
ncbi:MAG: hypothetical protein ACXVJO_13520, partial [Thermoanaerobaculia bacterium]